MLMSPLVVSLVSLRREKQVMSWCGFVFQLLPLQAGAGSSNPGLVWESELHRYGAVWGDLGWELPRGICHRCSGVMWQEGCRE